MIVRQHDVIQGEIALVRNPATAEFRTPARYLEAMQHNVDAVRNFDNSAVDLRRATNRQSVKTGTEHGQIIRDCQRSEFQTDRLL